MYRKVQQLTFDDFVFPYGTLDPNNEWVRLAAIVPWDVAEREYARRFVDNGHPAHPARIAVLSGQVRLGEKRCALLNTLTLLYEQQLYMYENNKHSVPDRIVSIAQPWVKPIVRGKAHANTEFGPKLHLSMVNGYARIVRLSFDAFNEATDFIVEIDKMCIFTLVDMLKKRNRI